MRSSIRRLRLYYKSFSLLTSVFRGWWKILVFPFFGSGEFVPRSGPAIVRVPPHLWTMLPTAARCVRIGVDPVWEADGLHLKSDRVEIVAPADAKEAATFFREVFLEDVYGIQRHDLRDREVVDVGAYVGESAVAFALRGARVQAFEPVPESVAYIQRNAGINGVADRITVHPVGLSNEDAPGPGITLVNAGRYLAQLGIREPYLLKMDCEGCEYAVLSCAEFWSAFRPRHVFLEFHKGGSVLAEILEREGYEVDQYDRASNVGYLYAHARADAESP